MDFVYYDIKRICIMHHYDQNSLQKLSRKSLHAILANEVCLDVMHVKTFARSFKRLPELATRTFVCAVL